MSDTEVFTVFAVTLYVVDFDEIGERYIRHFLESAPHLTAPKVVRVRSRDVEWSDEHPLNYDQSAESAFIDLFGAETP